MFDSPDGTFCGIYASRIDADRMDEVCKRKAWWCKLSWTGGELPLVMQIPSEDSALSKGR